MSTSGIQNSNDTTAVLEMVLMSASFLIILLHKDCSFQFKRLWIQGWYKYIPNARHFTGLKKLSLQLLLGVLQWLHQCTYVTDVVSQHSEMGPSSPSLKSVPDRRQDEELLQHQTISSFKNSGNCKRMAQGMLDIPAQYLTESK